MLQMSESFFAGVSKMCMIMELRCLHLLHTSLHLSLSLSLNTPPYSLNSLPLAFSLFYSMLDLSSLPALSVTLALDCHRNSL